MSCCQYNISTFTNWNMTKSYITCSVEIVDKNKRKSTGWLHIFIFVVSYCFIISYILRRLIMILHINLLLYMQGFHIFAYKINTLVDCQKYNICPQPIASHKCHQWFILWTVISSPQFGVQYCIKEYAEKSNCCNLRYIAWISDVGVRVGILCCHKNL